MAIQTLTERSGRFLGWHHTEVVAHGVTSDTLSIPPLMAGQRIYAKVTASTNSASVEFTLSSDATVAAGTAKWETWASGVAVGTKSAILLGPVTGVRCTTATTASVNTTFDVVVG